MSPSHVVGIDLGTTHSALASARVDDPDSRPEVLAVPQLVSPGLVEAGVLLPSFLYFAHESEGAQALPWAAMSGGATGGRESGHDAGENELRLLPSPAGRSASKTRAGALMTRGSIILRKNLRRRWIATELGLARVP